MTPLRVLLSRVAGFLRPGGRDARLREEIQAHLDDLAARHRAGGSTPEAARAAAQREFGGLDQMTEAFRDQRGLPMLDALRQDVRHALRGMWRSPAFGSVAVLTLALGIGANTAMFSLADALVLKPMPVDRPGEWRALFQVIRAGGRALKSGTLLPYSLYPRLRESTALADAVAFAELDDLVVTDGRGRDVQASGPAFVTSNFFASLGVTPALGHAFATGAAASESSREPDSSREIVLSDRFWKRAFNGDPTALGASVRIGSGAFTIVGVTPPAFFGLVLGRSPDVYLPIEAFSVVQPGIVTAQDPGAWSVRVVGRMAPGVGDAAAAERLTAVLHADLGDVEDPKPVIELLPIDTGFSDLRIRFLRPVQVLMLMVSILLCTACANVAVMLLSRNTARRNELAVRMAMGASRRRMLQQLATEGLVLAAFAGALSLLLAPWAIRALVALLPGGATPTTLVVSLDSRVLLFTAALSLGATILFSLVPARRALGIEASGALVNRTRTASAHGAAGGDWLVVAQIAMAFIMLAAAGLLVRTLHDLSTANPGYDADRVLVLEVSPGSRGYTGERLTAYYLALAAHLEAIPGVQAATMSQVGLLGLNKTTGTLDAPGNNLADNERLVQVFFVGPRFFETLGIPVVSGRDFGASDIGVPTRIGAVNATAARRFFGTMNPVGSIVNTNVRIAAVVGDSRYNSLREPAVPALFVPFTQSRVRDRMFVSIRTASGDGGAAVLRVAREMDPLVPMRISPLETIREQSLSQERLLAVISGFFAVTATLLLAIGLFGLVTFRVRQRTSEIGVRLALGARPDQVIWQIVRQPLKLAILGVVLGVPASLAAARLMTNLLFGLTPGDIPTMAGATTGVLLIVAASAAWPAWRASRLDPATALRCE